MISDTFGNPWQKSYINKIRRWIGSSKKYGEPIFVSTNKQKDKDYEIDEDSRVGSHVDKW